MDGVAEPDVGVLPTLSEIERHVVCVADAGGEIHGPHIIDAPVLVGRIDQLVIPRWGEATEIVGPPVALDEDDVVRVDRADAVGALLIEVAQGGAPGKVPVGLVEQVVPGHPVLVHVDLGESLPQRGHLVAVLDTLPERGLGGVVVGNGRIVALTARRSVQVEDHVHLILLAPGDHAVGQFESDLQPRVLAGHRLLLDGQSEQVVVHRQANGVEAPRLHRIDVGLGAVVLQPGIVEILRGLLADELLDDGADLVLGVGKASRLEHVALLDHPSTKAHAAQQHVLTILVHDGRTVRGQAVLGLSKPGQSTQTEHKETKALGT